MTEPKVRKCTEDGCALETDDGVDFLSDQLRHDRKQTEKRMAGLESKFETVATGLLELTHREPKGDPQKAKHPPHDRKGVIQCNDCGDFISCPACYKPPEGEKDVDAKGPRATPGGPPAKPTEPGEPGGEADPFETFARIILGDEG